MEEVIRKVIYSHEFEEYYASIDEQLRKKYDYALEIVRTQYVVSTKIVKNLENTDFYELRVSVGSNECRTILLAVDHDNFIQSKNVLLLNSFLKKSTKVHIIPSQCLSAKAASGLFSFVFPARDPG